ncbi:hypothetical protein [Nannocystis radixulma]|uniref:Uncharacterized protein n=1 Tax=Nannocystis radixulma TaxID=2995305 RepID=A0ABT5B462_9BACT|nr:hypothetical protein [Nannocystis radixulma]MDC0667912.1 hypothetical protein [Nannocystis radixulma]
MMNVAPSLVLPAVSSLVAVGGAVVPVVGSVVPVVGVGAVVAGPVVVPLAVVVAGSPVDAGSSVVMAVCGPQASASSSGRSMCPGGQVRRDMSIPFSGRSRSVLTAGRGWRQEACHHGAPGAR